MSNNTTESGYTGFTYGEVTPYSKKAEGQHISGLSSRTANGRVFRDDVRPDTKELGFTPSFHKGTPFEKDQIDALKTDILARFEKEGLAPQVVINQHEEPVDPVDHILGITFYVPVTDKEKLEKVINDIDSNAESINIPADAPKETQPDAPKVAQRADGNNWSNSLGDRTGLRKG